MGTKLREKDIASSGTIQTDYCGNVIYNNMTPTILLTDNGYVTLSDNKYHFYYKDHEGNNRVVANQLNPVEQVNNYYPFGLSYKNDAITNANKYKYNGKELQTMHGFDWYDYGARFYDPELCQWHAMDPACEKYYDISPYAYCAGNPINIIEIGGDSIIAGKEIEDKNSPNNNIYINNQIQYPETYAEVYSHEANGHALLYTQTRNRNISGHHGVKGLETNILLKKYIIDSRKETILNMHSR